jgi:arylsulfatase A-like enzyme
MRPNFLFIIADDLNSWIGVLGRNPDVKTPNIDRLAKRGVLFVNAYCSAPYCNASRMGIFTGCLPSTTGIYQNEPLWQAVSRRTTFVEHLRDAGYYTFGAGKVFHGVFDYAKAGRERADSAEWREIENRPFLWDAFVTNTIEPLPPQRPVNKLFDFNDFASVPPMYHHFDWGPLPLERENDTPDTKVATSISDFLKNPVAQPFFCAAGFYKPHLPWHAPKRFFDMYDVSRIALPLVKQDDLDDVPPIGREWALSPRDHELITSRDQWSQAVQGYLAAISYADELIGRILEVLDDTGLATSTYVVLCGDNGFHLGEKLHWRKFVLWEEATRVPLIVVPPTGQAVSRRVYEPVSLIDIYPTLIELGGAASPQRTCDAFSLAPFLVREDARRPAGVITTWGRGNHSLRTEHWRYTRYRDGCEELYDQAADPYEWTNLAGDPTFHPICGRMQDFLPRDFD